MSIGKRPTAKCQSHANGHGRRKRVNFKNNTTSAQHHKRCRTRFLFSAVFFSNLRALVEKIKSTVATLTASSCCCCWSSFSQRGRQFEKRLLGEWTVVCVCVCGFDKVPHGGGAGCDDNPDHDDDAGDSPVPTALVGQVSLLFKKSAFFRE